MNKYSYDKSLKTGVSGVFFNANYILTLPAPLIVKLLYPTRITPHNVIFASVIFGFAAGVFYLSGEYYGYVAAVILLNIKNVLDKVDGQLARARNKASRYGRFLDSLSDFLINVVVYSSISYTLYITSGRNIMWLAGAAALFFSFLQCTYFVYYQVSYINRVKPLGLNRTDESITEEDRKELTKTEEGRKILFLQKVYLKVYGWQDWIFRTIDIVCLSRIEKRFPDQDIRNYWYEDKKFLSLASFLGLGVQIGTLSLFSLFNELYLYFIFIIIPANIYLIILIMYRYLSAFIHFRKIDNQE
ncbi:MAG: CDP-alcohol phosphatidyltransferase family protein [bacterium]|nr:CDP-alcohol phosphatidyltransferase family protein [bacterium]